MSGCQRGKRRDSSTGRRKIKAAAHQQLDSPNNPNARVVEPLGSPQGHRQSGTEESNKMKVKSEYTDEYFGTYLHSKDTQTHISQNEKRKKQ